MKNSIGIALLISVLLVLSGCRTAVPIYNVEESAIVSSAGNVSMDQVAKAIKRAGGGLGWVMKDGGPGEIIGTLNLRKHMAVVSVRYTTGFYSIKYKDSRELNYDGANIHKNYNGWIQNLDKGIQTQLNYL